MIGSAPAEGHVRAAGGAVWRHTAAGDLEVLLVHRPHYDDWSLPKGKADPAESDEDCALREVEEETGLRCALGDHLHDVEYVDRHGLPKVARYWAMQPVAGRFAVNQEVDEVRWLTLPQATRVLTRPQDADVLAALARRLGA